MTDYVWKVHHIRDKTVVAIYVFSGGNESGSATGTEVALASNTGEPLLREKEARRLFGGTGVRGSHIPFLVYDLRHGLRSMT